MKPSELLRLCADKLDADVDPCILGTVLVHPRGAGKFPFSGGGTEKLNETQGGSAYYVPVHRILSGLAKALKP